MCSYIDDEEKSKPESFSPESPCMVKGDRTEQLKMVLELRGREIALGRDAFARYSDRV